MIAGDDPSPWKLLADGTVVGIERDHDTIVVIVEVRALRVNVRLAGCDAVRYQPHDEPMLYELADIAASQPDIRDASVVDHAIVVDGGAGQLRLNYANLEIEIDGVGVDLDELARRSRRGSRPV